MTQNLPSRRDDRTPAPSIPAGMPVTAWAYPLTGPPQQSLTDASELVMEVLAIFTEAGDRLQRALQKAYPCALCGENLAGRTPWQQRQHLAQHPLRDQARVIGWFRAVTGT